jgi:MoxR-like ATPase
MVRPHTEDLVLPDGILERVTAALSSQKHLLLVGPPGTAKTELALRLIEAARSEEYCTGAFVASASADWTTYDTIGGYALQKDGSLRFRPGALLRALEARQWLVIDELNRADVDKAFGELMTVLAGRATDTSYELANGRTVRVGPDATATHPMPKTFRIIATMNTWDKTSLFRLSYALQRRFAIVHVGCPDNVAYASLVRRAATQTQRDAALVPAAVDAMCTMFSSEGLLAVRELGPALALDSIQYMRRRIAVESMNHWGDAMAEAIAMYVLPQLEGIDDQSVLKVAAAIDGLIMAGSTPRGRSEMRSRIQDVFPHVELAP